MGKRYEGEKKAGTYTVIIAITTTRCIESGNNLMRQKEARLSARRGRGVRTGIYIYEIL